MYLKMVIIYICKRINKMYFIKWISKTIKSKKLIYVIIMLYYLIVYKKINSI